MQVKYLKLETELLRIFDDKLSPDIMNIEINLFRMIIKLFVKKKIIGFLSIIFKSIFHGSNLYDHFYMYNITRKAIRLPEIFDNIVAKTVLRRIKIFQVIILMDYLELILEEFPDALVLVLGGSLYPYSVLAEVARKKKNKILFVERGYFADSFQIDPVGPNACNSLPGDPLFYKNLRTTYCQKDLPEKLNVRIRKSRSQEKIRKLERGYVFVAFQVPTDTQIMQHSHWIKSMEEFLEIVLILARNFANERFVIKEHPAYRRNIRRQDGLPPNVVFANINRTEELIENSRAVITINSTVGIEGLLKKKPVILLGDACYRIDGLVLTAKNEQELIAALEKTRTWKMDEFLRKQYLGYLWNEYLFKEKVSGPDATRLFLNSRVEYNPHFELQKNR